MKYLGIDYSKKKVGLAIGESDSRIAVPLEVIVGGDDVLERIVKLANDERIDAFVLGIPVPVHEEQSLVQFERVKAFSRHLQEVSRLPVHEIDEVMTTREARRVQDEHGSGVAEDALAAMMILQEYLDSQGNVVMKPVSS